MIKPEEIVIIRQIQQRNQKVFEAIFYDYYPSLMRFAESMIFDLQVCEDIVQDLFLHIWENSQSITITTSLKSYLFQSVKNKCFNHLRNIKIHDKHNLIYLESHLNLEDIDDIEDSSIEILSEAIEAMPNQMALVLKMKYMDNKKYQEIAESINISENTVKTHLKRAREKLKRVLLENSTLKFFL